MSGQKRSDTDEMTFAEHIDALRPHLVRGVLAILALAVAARVYMLENAVYSVISPEGAASILYKDAGQVERAAEALRITAGELKKFGVVEEVISEQSGFEAACAELKKLWIRDLDEIEKLDSRAMLDARYNRFRKFGGLME